MPGIARKSQRQAPLLLQLHQKSCRSAVVASQGGPENSPAQDGTRRPVSATQDGEVPAELNSRRNGYVQTERPATAEAKVLTLAAVANGVSEKSPQRKSQVHGGVQQGGTHLQQEAMVHEWSVNHLRDEMNYIKDVRNSLEKLRERMYGQFGGMQQSVQKLSQDIRAANVQRQDLEAQVKVRTAAMDSLDHMNSSLLSANISLQKSLLENCLQRVEKQDELKSLRSSWQRAEAQLRERDQQLAAARAENLNLRLQVESSQEATSQALQEMSQKLQSQYEEQLKAEQQKHQEEIEALQAQIDEYVRRLEEAERNVRLAEAKIAERDQRISEVERLLDCMGQEKSQLMQKLQDCEERIHILEQTDHVDEAILNKSEQLESEAAELKERIKHLNDMVFCQQRKVKAMIEEVEMLRATVVQKDLFITELLDRIAMAECENKSKPVVETRDVGVSCDLPIRPEAQPAGEVQHRPVRWNPHTYSRLESSLLRYTPQQYSLMLQSGAFPTSDSVTSPSRSTADHPNPAPIGPTEQKSARSGSVLSAPEQATQTQTEPATSSSPTEKCSPYNQLAQINEDAENE